ncbi:golgin subfamily A member 2-like [Diadema antillarum]|uniref:golgin subfamily A member 2-like n=1 Tax=Diadema antillarum TaxID=105358 RepID=UPI003A8BB212
MADISREEKLAAARKKLQKFQQKRTPSNTPGGPSAKSAKSASKAKSKSSAGGSRPESPAPNARQTRTEPPQQTGQLGDHHLEAKRDEVAASSSFISSPPNDTSQNASSHHHSDKPLSSAESLRQLSRQLNGLMSETSLVNGEPSTANGSNGMSDLEIRNQELAAEVDHQTQTNRRLMLEAEQLKQQCKRLQESIDKERSEFAGRAHKEQSALKEQLQVHIQTIGILVSEKSDLQGALNQLQSGFKQKTDEVENLASRLQVSRQRVAELERGLASATNSSQQLQKTSKELDKEKDSLKIDVYKLQKSNDELSQQNSELTNQLRAKSSENGQLGQVLGQLQERLQLAELQVQQLTAQSGQGQEAQTVLHRIQEEKADLEKKLAQYVQSVEQLTAERQHLHQQYQQHSLQLQEHIQQLNSQNESLQAEKTQMISRQEELQQEINTLQENQGDQIRDDVSVSSVSQEEVIRLEQRLAALTEERQAMLTQYQNLATDNANLSQLYQEKEEEAETLRRDLGRLQDEAVDKGSLLEGIQSDKATISRALAQNKELKVQLEELQTAFVKMSQDNMELTTQLQSEQHVSSELGSRLGQQESELEDTRSKLESSESELERLKTQTYEMNKQLMQHATLADRAQHFEAQGTVNESLRIDLQQAQEKIHALGNENSKLRVRIASLETYQPSSNSTEETDGESPKTDRNDMMDHLSAAIRQLEMERDGLKRALEDQQEEYKMLLKETDSMRYDLSSSRVESPVTQEAYETLELAMEKLQEKFCIVMREKAELDDRIQELEHVNLQLAGETETIGEYITLYHNQRDIMKRRQDDRERFVAMLASEKEVMESKLTQLQNLVVQLLQEKQHLQPYVRQSDINSALTPPRDTRNAFKISEATEATEEMQHSGENDIGTDWPSSSTEGADEPQFEEVSLADEHHHQLANSLSSLPSPDQLPRSEHTAQQIIQLLHQMGGTPAMIDRSTILDRDFMPCKYCSDVVLHV